MDSAGDLDNGKAWRAVRRPSDMVFIPTMSRTSIYGSHCSQNEYSKQIKEFRAQEKPGKAHGKVFVKGQSVLWFYQCVFVIHGSFDSSRTEEPDRPNAAKCNVGDVHSEQRYSFCDDPRISIRTRL